MRSYNDLNHNYTGGNLDIRTNNLNSLESCPKVITGVFDCDNNKLSNLIGGPERVDGIYYCQYNQLTSLVGCASHIGGTLFLNGNTKITSLVGIHKIIKSCSSILFNHEPITEGGIGLILIDRLQDLPYIYGLSHNPFSIINSYLGSGTKGMMACRKELIENGYEQYAKL